METSLNIVNCYNDKMGGFKGDKEFGLNDIIDISFDKGFKLSTIQSFQDIKTPNIERLDKMRWMYKKIKDDDVLLFTKFFELDWKVVLIVI